jgi:hypothetical protein
MMDRFQVARDLKRFVGHWLRVWTAVRQPLAGRSHVYDGRGSRIGTGDCGKSQEAWQQFKNFLMGHKKSGIRPMGSADCSLI